MAAAASLASSLNLHKVVVGTVFVASVTSAPELFSSLVAQFSALRRKYP
ncbi:MAG: hypothetical protein ACP5JW_02880 [Candidatus Bathyarchaeia archaeon]